MGQCLERNGDYNQNIANNLGHRTDNNRTNQHGGKRIKGCGKTLTELSWLHPDAAGVLVEKKGETMAKKKTKDDACRCVTIVLFRARSLNVDDERREKKQRGRRRLSSSTFRCCCFLLSNENKKTKKKQLLLR